MTDRDIILEPFRRALADLSSANALTNAALAIGRASDPALDLERMAGELERLTAAIVLEAGASSGGDRIGALNRALFVSAGFRGNQAQDDDPRNGYLHEALQRRLGLPIILSILYMHCGQRAGLNVEGVGFPGHFVVRVGAAGAFRYVDPFNGGREIARAQLAALLRRQGGDPDRHLDMFLAAVTPRQILARVLQNLKGMYLNRSNFIPARRVVDLLLVLSPWALEEIRDRGLLSSYLGDLESAQADLGAYLARQPEAADAPRVKERLAWIRRQRGTST